MGPLGLLLFTFMVTAPVVVSWVSMGREDFPDLFELSEDMIDDDNDDLPQRRPLPNSLLSDGSFNFWKIFRKEPPSPFSSALGLSAALSSVPPVESRSKSQYNPLSSSFGSCVLLLSKLAFLLILSTLILWSIPSCINHEFPNCICAQILLFMIRSHITRIVETKSIMSQM